MSATIKIIDGHKGIRQGAMVDKEGSLHVTVHPEPPIEVQLTKPFRAYLETSAGSNDMGVDGSSTEQEFYIQASETDDRYITTLSFIVGYGTSGEPNQWADGSALTNGIRLFYEPLNGEVDIHDAIKSNQDLFRIGNETIANNWEVRHVSASNDYGYFVHVDLKRFSNNIGIKLDKGTRQRLVATVRDNLSTTTDTMNILAYGFDRFEL